jgi:hypothetical protein
MRRVVVTPTFAAGLGVVVAAVLAYPMQTVFNYAGPAETPCQPAPAPCGLSDGGKAPPLGSGNRMKTAGPSAPHSGGNRSTSAAQHDSHGTGGRGQAGAPQLTYHTYSKGQWGFAGTIEITFQAEHAHDHWRLRFGYPSARIVKVWAGKLIPHGAHNAEVGSWDWPGEALSDGLVRVSIGVAGHPGPPHRCSFNGRPCHIIERTGSGAATGTGGRAGPGAAGGHAHQGGTGTRSGTGRQHPGGAGRSGTAARKP